jgi:hypothetical protein
MQRVGIDDAKTSLENELSKPLPGRKQKVSDKVADDEMALFMAAAAGR